MLSIVGAYPSRAFTGLLGVAADDLDLVGGHDLPAIIQLELNVLDKKRPDFVAESVGAQASL